MNEQLTALISLLFQSSTQTHVFHLQTNSFSEHMALGEYYDEIVEKADALAESAQGMYGILKAYKAYSLVDYKDKAQLIAYFEELCSKVEALRVGLPSYLQNQVDGIEELLYSTKYKLKFLN